MYRYLDSALQINPIILHIPTYPTYRHRRFHIIYCKAQNRHFKSDKVYIEKSTFISQSIDHIIANTFAGMCTSTLILKTNHFFHFYTEILPPISSDRYFLHFQKHYFFNQN